MVWCLGTGSALLLLYSGILLDGMRNFAHNSQFPAGIQSRFLLSMSKIHYYCCVTLLSMILFFTGIEVSHYCGISFHCQVVCRR